MYIIENLKIKQGAATLPYSMRTFEANIERKMLGC